MPSRLHHYVAQVIAGPGDPLVTVQIMYLDRQGDEIGLGGGSLMAFGATWKDVAKMIHDDVVRLGLHDTGGMRTPSPHLDLT